MGVKVYYEEYVNDYNRRDKVEYFSSLNKFADILFENATNYTWLYFTNAERNKAENNGRFEFDSSCISSTGRKFNIYTHKIEKDGKIIYSDGKFTNGISHASNEVCEWLKECNARKRNPQFDFAE